MKSTFLSLIVVLLLASNLYLVLRLEQHLLDVKKLIESRPLKLVKCDNKASKSNKKEILDAIRKLN